MELCVAVDAVAVAVAILSTVTTMRRYALAIQTCASGSHTPESVVTAPCVSPWVASP